MRKVIIYGSLYGSTKSYAETLSKLTGIPAYSYRNVNDLSMYQQIVYLGALYSGKVLGLKQTVRHASEKTKFIIITVGIDNIFDKKNVEKIKKSIQKQIPSTIYKKAKIFHLKGKIDYSRLTLKHRLIMALLYQSLKERSTINWAEEENMFIKTYFETADFVEYTSLIPIVEEMM